MAGGYEYSPDAVSRSVALRSIASDRQFCLEVDLQGKVKTILWIIVLKQPNAAWR
jgi:hypothetical protein